MGSLPKQMHLDFEVDDLDEGERHVLNIGARKSRLPTRRDFQSVPGPCTSPVLSDYEE